MSVKVEVIVTVERGPGNEDEAGIRAAAEGIELLREAARLPSEDPEEPEDEWDTTKPEPAFDLSVEWQTDGGPTMADLRDALGEDRRLRGITQRLWDVESGIRLGGEVPPDKAKAWGHAIYQARKEITP